MTFKKCLEFFVNWAPSILLFLAASKAGSGNFGRKTTSSSTLHLVSTNHSDLGSFFSRSPRLRCGSTDDVGICGTLPREPEEAIFTHISNVLDDAD